MQGCPEPYTYAVYDGIFDQISAKDTKYTPFINGSGQRFTFEFMRCTVRTQTFLIMLLSIHRHQKF
jgi:hypothetical protein